MLLKGWQDQSVLGLQTWLEGEPVKGRSAKPAKPTKAAALQLLQQLASQYCPAVDADGDPSHTDASLQISSSNLPQMSLHAEPAVASLGFSSAHEVDTTAANELPQAELSLAQTSQTALSSSDSDCEAAVSPRGGVAVDEEDDRQGPEAALPGLTLAQVEEEHYCEADPVALTSARGSASADMTNCALNTLTVGLNPPARAARKQSGQPSLAEVKRQQRCRVSISQVMGSGQPEVLLALTAAQQMQLEADQRCSANIAAVMNTAAQCSNAQLQTGSLASDAEEAEEQQHDGHQVVTSASSRSFAAEADEEKLGLSGHAEDDQQLWQSLAAAMQSSQLSAKLAQLTVTLLARM